MMIPSLLIPCLAALPSAQAAARPTVEVPELRLHLILPELDDFEARSGRNEQLRGAWLGKWGEHRVEIRLWLLPREEWGLFEPDAVLENLVFNERQEPAGADFGFVERGYLGGAYGALPYAAWARAERRRPGEAERTLIALGGVTAERAYSVQVTLEPPADEAARARVLAFFRDGVRYDGPVEDPRWTDEEAVGRWERDRPAEVAGKLKFERTAHYLILTDSSSGKLFGKKMEECYAAIQETYPFSEVEGRKLLPVFLFRTSQEYVDYYAKIAGISTESAGASKGHAWRDYYATYYEAPADPVHVHEATHQVFANRLGLSGGGSWFQEGVAQYMSTSHNQRKAFAKGAAKRGGFTPFREFVAIPSLLHGAEGEKDPKGGSVAGNHYLQAASIIAFLRESKFGRDRFPEFLARAGSAPPGQPTALDVILQDLYGVDLEGLEAQWRSHWLSN